MGSPLDRLKKAANKGIDEITKKVSPEKIKDVKESADKLVDQHRDKIPDQVEGVIDRVSEAIDAHLESGSDSDAGSESKE